ncbi:MAG: hypothetical protein K8I02_08545, partial [Candidatus Methylomirabilis sp.]|nr:hypothetical protein [Deltaproteobacteria bacterium]
MPDEALYTVNDGDTVKAEDTNQCVRAIQDLQSHRASNPTFPFEGDIHFKGSTGHLGTLSHEATEARTWTLPEAAGTLALQSSMVTDHGALSGLEDDDHPQYLDEPRADEWLEEKSTDDLAEGAANLYHTTDRVRNALGATSPLSYSASDGVVSIPQAGAGQNGYLSSSDWSTFNGKAAGSHTHSASDITAGLLGVARGGTGLSTAAQGDVLYASAADTLARLAGNTTTTQKFLSQTGNGSSAGAPSWVELPSTGAGTALQLWDFSAGSDQTIDDDWE